jgi:hypothetical protein
MDWILDRPAASQAMWGETSAQLVSPSVQRKNKSGRTKHTQDTDRSGIIIEFTMIYHGLS